jgi:hypothetical protein
MDLTKTKKEIVNHLDYKVRFNIIMQTIKVSYPHLTLYNKIRIFYIATRLICLYRLMQFSLFLMNLIISKKKSENEKSK